MPVLVLRLIDRSDTGNPDKIAAAMALSPSTATTLSVAE